MVKTGIILSALAFLGVSRWTEEHEYSPSTSNQIASAIKDKLYFIIHSD